jgi:hypothetical protein
MVAIISLLVIITLSIIITRIATIVLAHTGLSEQSARFQARSAFTRAGFTTHESERVVNHPVRRRIIMLLMLLGNVGIVSAVSLLILTFVDQNGSVSTAFKVIFLIAGLTLLWIVAMSRWVDLHLSRLIDWTRKRYTHLDIQDYASLMHLAGEYRIVEIRIDPEDWLAHQTLGQAQLREEGIMVLGVQRQDGTYLGVPTGTTKVLPKDILIVYGRVSVLAALDERRKDWSGNCQHRAAVRDNLEVIHAEEDKDPGEHPREQRS